MVLPAVALPACPLTQAIHNRGPAVRKAVATWGKARAGSGTRSTGYTIVGLRRPDQDLDGPRGDSHKRPSQSPPQWARLYALLWNTMHKNSLEAPLIVINVQNYPSSGALESPALN